MATLDVYMPNPYRHERINIVLVGNMSFFPLPIPEDVPWKRVNAAFIQTAVGTGTGSMSVGLYTLSGGTLSMVNFATGTTTYSNNNGIGYLPLTSVSATTYLTPGMYYFGINMTTSGGAPMDCVGNSSQSTLSIWWQNPYPGVFQAGSATASTSALPSSVATTDIDVTFEDATGTKKDYGQPYFILSS